VSEKARNNSVKGRLSKNAINASLAFSALLEIDSKIRYAYLNVSIRKRFCTKFRVDIKNKPVRRARYNPLQKGIFKIYRRLGDNLS
jgi:hypothetical protein